MANAKDEASGLDRILDELEAGEGRFDAEIESVELLVFSLSERLFAFPGSDIREILPSAKVCFVPGCPPEIEGVVNVRGDIESLMTLYGALGLAAEKPGERWSILLGQAAGMRSGIRVDRVVDVVSVPKDSIRQPHTALSDTLRPLVTGILIYKGAAAAVLDLSRIFAGFLNAAG